MASHPRQPHVNQVVPLEVNLLCWVKLADYPWWPGRVLNREEIEATIELGAEEDLPAATETNSMVEWFDEEKNVSVLENDLICEYTTNMHLARQESLLVDMKLVLEACRGANKYLESNKRAIASQVQRYRKLQPFEEFIKPTTTPHSKTKSSADARPLAGRTFLSQEVKGKIQESQRSTKLEASPGKKNVSSSNTPHRKGEKRGKQRSPDPIDSINVSSKKQLQNSREVREKSISKTAQKPKRDEVAGGEAASEYSGKSRKRSPDETLPREISEKHDCRQIETVDDQSMTDGNVARKERKRTISNIEKDGSDGDGATEKPYKKRKVLEDDNEVADGGLSGENDRELLKAMKRKSGSDGMGGRSGTGCGERDEEEEFISRRSTYSDAASNSYKSSDDGKLTHPGSKDVERSKEDKSEGKTKRDGDDIDDVNNKLAELSAQVCALQGELKEVKENEKKLESAVSGLKVQ